MSVRRLFGTWKTAVETAGFAYEEVSGVRRWSRDMLIEKIQILAADEVSLDATYIEQHYSFLHRAAVKLFPRSWAKALLAAGFDPDEHKALRGNWERQSAEDWVRQRAAKGESLLARDVPRDLLGFVHKQMVMGWADFVEALSFPYPGVKKRKDWSRGKLLSEIRRWHEEGNPRTTGP